MHPESDMYVEGETRWSGEPNGALIDLVGQLGLANNPGTAVDFGCGEGADAVWLAQQGIAVTGVDPSPIALAQAKSAADAAGVEVSLVEGYAPEALTGTWDLVVGMYAPVHSDPVKLGKLLGAVAPGGHLLFVHHEMPDDFFEGVDWRGDFLFPRELAKRLPESEWEILVDEVRARRVIPGASAHHVSDELLVARKKS